MTNSRLDAINRVLKNNSPTILSGAAVAGVITTAVLSAKAAVEAQRKLDDFHECKEFEQRNPTRQEDFGQVWKILIPPAVSGVATIACIVGANQIGLRRNAALLGAYTLADTAFREYKDEVLSQIGEAKEQKVQDKLAEKQLENNPVTNNTVIIGSGDQLCYDRLTGRYFRSDIETIRQAANQINADIISDMYASHNEFYSLLGLAPVDIGDELGWNIDNRIDLVFSSHLADDGRACLAVGYKSLPHKDYGKF